MKMRTFQGLFVLVLSLCAAQVAMTEASLDFSIITLPKHPLPRTESKQTSREAQGELFNSLGVTLRAEYGPKCLGRRSAFGSRTESDR